MILKLVLVVAFLAGIKFIHHSLTRKALIIETPPDETWWNGLNAEWKTIFLINQTIEESGIDIYQIQNDYINRMNKDGDAPLTEMNTSLDDLNAAREFGLSYTDFFARVSRKNNLTKNQTIDLKALARLEMLYIVNSPADISPLRKITHLKTLILNFGGRSDDKIENQKLDLDPIRHLMQLKTLHCASCPIQSLESVSNLINLEELSVVNTPITSLNPLKKLINLKRLSIGSSVKSIGSIRHLTRLEELYVHGCKDLSGIAALKELKKLSVTENEFAVVDGAYRIKDLSFLQDLRKLEVVDLKGTSYKGDLTVLSSLPGLRVITLPGVSALDAEAFRKRRPDCVIINAYEFER